MKLLIWLVLVALVALSSAAPSDLIKTVPRPSIISLSGTTPDSARAIDALNEPLGAFGAWELPNIGHYASWAAMVSQDEPTGVPGSLLNFSAQKAVALVSVGNASSVNVTEINGTMAWF